MNENMPVISKVIDKKNNFDVKNSSLIYNIEYVSEFKNGSFYVITSEVGELISNQPGLIKMKKVIATINLNNSSPIKISADGAIYDNLSHNTKFYENVIMNYNEHNTNSDNLDLLLDKNLATLFNNVIYKNLDAVLKADKMEIDLITKNSKIFMNELSDKINIISIN
jgi:lipopolysaccharide export system protein LptA